MLKYKKRYFFVGLLIVLLMLTGGIVMHFNSVDSLIKYKDAQYNVEKFNIIRQAIIPILRLVSPALSEFQRDVIAEGWDFLDLQISPI